MGDLTKVVYRDGASGRLITRLEAKKRDPSSWTEEVVVVVDGRSGASSDVSQPANGSRANG